MDPLGGMNGRGWRKFLLPVYLGFGLAVASTLLIEDVQPGARPRGV
jgi:hypothetical protein